MPGPVEFGQGSPEDDGLAGADLARDDAQSVLVDAPADPGDGLEVAGVPVQHRGARSRRNGLRVNPK